MSTNWEIEIHLDPTLAARQKRGRVPQVSIVRPGKPRTPCERIASVWPHRRWLLFFFFDGAFGVGQDFVGYQLRDDVVVVHFHAVGAFALGH